MSARSGKNQIRFRRLVLLGRRRFRLHLSALGGLSLALQKVVHFFRRRFRVDEQEFANRCQGRGC